SWAGSAARAAPWAKRQATARASTAPQALDTETPGVGSKLPRAYANGAGAQAAERLGRTRAAQEARRQQERQAIEGEGQHEHRGVPAPHFVHQDLDPPRDEEGGDERGRRAGQPERRSRDQGRSQG